MTALALSPGHVPRASFFFLISEKYFHQKHQTTNNCYSEKTLRWVLDLKTIINFIKTKKCATLSNSAKSISILT